MVTATKGQGEAGVGVEAQKAKAARLLAALQLVDLLRSLDGPAHHKPTLDELFRETGEASGFLDDLIELSSGAALGREGQQVQRFPGPGFRAGPVCVNPETADVLVSGRPIELTPIQLKILVLLVKNGGRIVPRERMALEVWGEHLPLCYRHYLAMHIKSLRMKLGDSCIQPSIIVNVRGMGYKIGGAMLAPTEAGEAR